MSTKRPAKPYARTSVKVAKSRADIDELLEKHGVRGLQWTVDNVTGAAQVRFLWALGDKPAMARLRIRATHDDQQERRRLYRGLFWHLKSTFEAVDAGIIDARHVFLPYTETSPDGPTVAELIGGHMQLEDGSSQAVLALPSRTVRVRESEADDANQRYY